ncbi:YqaE/Pmp3 family membrane protein [Fulvivirga kasyanovii]|uniref:YqaE/Pmp3 family membrane protein n=2 Tax=Fulvivirga kasyanovii TaxID=396812 RepID=A0ABW9RRJ8_9BACT|nr:YqaE/Pmp3 family membrane protein [Fulvivirga kasyanovii]
MMILAVIIPPLAVGLTYGVIDKFWISLLLTILFFIPGMIYSLIVVHNHFR